MDKANERLISAAQDLLDAAICGKALDMRFDAAMPILSKYGFNPENRFDLTATEFVENMRNKAIAKALGE